MAYEKVKEYLTEQGFGERFEIREKICDTVTNAAISVGCREAQIAKTMTFLLGEEPIAIVCAGDAKVKNAKFKACFSAKPTMIPFERVEELTGHAPGGVCPFMMNDGVKIYLDVSLKRFKNIWSAGGSEDSTVQLNPDELAKLSAMTDWVDVCGNWDENLRD